MERFGLGNFRGGSADRGLYKGGGCGAPVICRFGLGRVASKFFSSNAGEGDANSGELPTHPTPFDNLLIFFVLFFFQFVPLNLSLAFTFVSFRVYVFSF